MDTCHRGLAVTQSRESSGGQLGWLRTSVYTATSCRFGELNGGLRKLSARVC